MEGQRLGLSALLANGRFDVLLAAALAVLSVTLGVFRGAGWTVILDVAAAVLAGLTVRWPVWAGTGLGLLLVGYLFLPETAATMGEYAPLVPILGAGMRGQRRQRAWMSGGFGAVLAALTYQDYPGSPLFLLGVLVWAVLIAVLWLIGNLFTAYRRADSTRPLTDCCKSVWRWPASCTIRLPGLWHGPCWRPSGLSPRGKAVLHSRS